MSKAVKAAEVIDGYTHIIGGSSDQDAYGSAYISTVTLQKHHASFQESTQWQRDFRLFVEQCREESLETNA